MTHTEKATQLRALAEVLMRRFRDGDEWGVLEESAAELETFARMLDEPAGYGTCEAVPRLMQIDIYEAWSKAYHEADKALRFAPLFRLPESPWLSIHAMRAPFDDWKGELERKALDAANAALAGANGKRYGSREEATASLKAYRQAALDCAAACEELATAWATFKNAHIAGKYDGAHECVYACRSIAERGPQP